MHLLNLRATEDRRCEGVRVGECYAGHLRERHDDAVGRAKRREGMSGAGQAHGVAARVGALDDVDDFFFGGGALDGAGRAGDRAGPVLPFQRRILRAEDCLDKGGGEWVAVRGVPGRGDECDARGVFHEGAPGDAAAFRSTHRGSLSYWDLPRAAMGQSSSTTPSRWG